MLSAIHGDPTMGMIIFPHMVHPLKYSRSFFHITPTQTHTFPDGFIMGISEIVALVAFTAPQFILSYM